MKRTNIYFSDVQWKRLGVLSKKVGLKRSELIRRAVDEYLDRQDRKASRAKRKKEK